MAKAKKRVISINMEGVDSSTLVPEGDYPVLVDEISQETSQAGKPYLKWVLKIADGQFKGQKLWHQTSLQPQALFNLKNTLIALGVAVPNSLLKLDLDELEGLTMGVTVEHETYDGKKRARVTDVFPLDSEDYEEDDEDEDESSEVEDDEDASDDDSEDEEESDDEEEIDLESMDLEELTAFAKENKIKLTKKAQKKAALARKEIAEALEEDEDDL